MGVSPSPSPFVGIRLNYVRLALLQKENTSDWIASKPVLPLYTA